VIDQIRWLGHGSFLLEGSPILYINPWRIVRSAFHADAILISSDQYDQCSTADVEKLRGPSTKVIGSESVASHVSGVAVLRPWQSISVDRASVKGVPVFRGEGEARQEASGVLGYIISINFHDIYYTGHTKLSPEMQYIHPDIAIVPLDQQPEYSVEDAIALVDTLRPRWVIPCNWGNADFGASQVEVQEFRERVSNFTEVVVPAINN
jgi:L-ascorbate metabolism protein UlaG (beta-lactamase superfamily)